MKNTFGICLLVIFLFGCAKKNYTLMEPVDPEFSGDWVVYSKETDKPMLNVQYKYGKKNGTQLSYRNYPDVETEMTFKDGILDGPLIRYDTYPDRKLVEGTFKDGKPWSGMFLIGGKRQIIESPFFPSPIQDLTWFAAEYRDGVRISVEQIGP